MLHYLPSGDAGPVSELGTAEGAIHHLMFCCWGAASPHIRTRARSRLLSPELAGACGEGEGEAGFPAPGEDAASVARRGAVGLIMAAASLIFHILAAELSLQGALIRRADLGARL